MNSDAIITADDLTAATTELRREGGVGRVMDTLQLTEPVLYGFVMTAAHCVAGRLALFDVAQPAVRATADDLLEVVLASVIAVRRAHARLWGEDGPPQIDLGF